MGGKAVSGIGSYGGLKIFLGEGLGVGGLEFHAENETPAKKKKLERIPAF